MMVQARTWKSWIVRGVLVLWGVQLLWLAWHFGPEARDLAVSLSQGDVGPAYRQQDPLYRWITSLAALIPPSATYVFLDNYEAGKEIEARYLLAPRRHILLSPQTPPGFLFYALHQEQATFLLIRDREKPLGPGAEAAVRSPAVRPVPLPGPGRVFRVDYRLLGWGFYD
jgi:hypothetical protein